MDDVWAWLLDKGFDASVKGGVKLAVLGTIAAGTYVLTRAAVRRGEVAVGDARGHTIQSPKVFVVGALCGLLALTFLVWGIADPASLEEPGAGIAWLLLIVGFTLGFVATAIYAQHRWTWDGDKLEWQGAFRKSAIAWRDLSRVGPSWDGQFVARDAKGRKVRWTTFTLEHEALGRVANAHLAQNRANIAG